MSFDSIAVVFSVDLWQQESLLMLQLSFDSDEFFLLEADCSIHWQGSFSVSEKSYSFIQKVRHRYDLNIIQTTIESLRRKMGHHEASLLLASR